MKLSKQTGIILALLAIIIVLLGLSGYFFLQYQKSQQQRTDPKAVTKAEIETLMEQVGKLIVLPKETPTLATVSDPKKLAKEPFFANSQKGDKVLIYPKSKKAILYRPGANIIIEVAPINSGEVAGAKSEVGEPTIAIYNGSTIQGLAAQTETKLGVSASKSTASRSDYKKTLVVDLSGKFKAKASEIAKKLNGEVSELPSGEIAPSSDLLVIVAE